MVLKYSWLTSEKRDLCRKGTQQRNRVWVIRLVLVYRTQNQRKSWLAGRGIAEGLERSVPLRGGQLGDVAYYNVDAMLLVIVSDAAISFCKDMAGVE